MHVIVANFGVGNYLWQNCLAKNAVATIAAAGLREYSQSNDVVGYVKYAMANVKTARGKPPVKGVATRWFNVALTIAETNGDLWVHRQEDQIWWATTNSEPSVAILKSLDIDPHYEVYKPVERWHNADRKGRPLRWSSLHPKAKDFIFLEGTLKKPSPDNALYIKALVNGDDLAEWHNRPAWRAKAATATRSATTVFSAMENAAWRMAETAFNTTETSNGQKVEVTRKNKDMVFEHPADLREFLVELMKGQDGMCALTDLPLEYDGQHDDVEMLASLDRIDSSGHYDKNNLQVVCRFINRWKGADDNTKALRLIQCLRTSPA